MPYTREEVPPTPQAHSSKIDALKLGAELIERELEHLRWRAMTHGHNPEALAMDAMDKGVRAGRLRAMVEHEEEDAARRKLEARR